MATAATETYLQQNREGVIQSCKLVKYAQGWDE